jgi:hypothetical protein
MTRVLSTLATPGHANPLEALSFTRGEAPGVSVTVSLTVHSKSPQPREVASDFLVEAPGVEPDRKVNHLKGLTKNINIYVDLRGSVFGGVGLAYSSLANQWPTTWQGDSRR